jgi:hypothetical protein
MSAFRGSVFTRCPHRSAPVIRSRLPPVPRVRPFRRGNRAGPGAPLFTISLAEWSLHRELQAKTLNTSTSRR